MVSAAGCTEDVGGMKSVNIPCSIANLVDWLSVGFRAHVNFFSYRVSLKTAFCYQDLRRCKL